MEWKIRSVKKETNHRFLNYYTLTYDVKKKDKEGVVEYYIASRHNENELLPLTHKTSIPDGVLIPLYYIDPNTKEISVLLTRQFRPAIGSYVTSVPAGLVDKNDKDILETAIREAKEEAGAVITDLEVLVDTGPTSSGFSDETNGIVLARIVSFEEKHLEEFEDIETKLYPLKEIPMMLKDKNLFMALEVKMILRYILIRFQDRL